MVHEGPLWLKPYAETLLSQSLYPRRCQFKAIALMQKPKPRLALDDTPVLHHLSTSSPLTPHPRQQLHRCHAHDHYRHQQHPEMTNSPPPRIQGPTWHSRALCTKYYTLNGSSYLQSNSLNWTFTWRFMGNDTRSYKSPNYIVILHRTRLITTHEPPSRP